MSGWQITEPTAGSTDWTSTATQREKQRKGFMAVSLSNWDDSTGTPAINAGSVVEMSGSVFQFTSTETITETFSTSNLNYIYLTASSSALTASCTSGAPTWSASKQGWYDAGGTKRCIGGYGINRNMKFLFTKGEDNLMRKKTTIGEWDMNTSVDGANSITVAHGLGGGWKGLRSFNVIIRNDADSEYHDFSQPLAIGTAEAVSQQMYLDANNVNLYMDANGGHFDTANYDSTGGYNRGWITIWYEV